MINLCLAGYSSNHIPNHPCRYRICRGPTCSCQCNPSTKGLSYVLHFTFFL